MERKNKTTATKNTTSQKSTGAGNLRRFKKIGTSPFSFYGNKIYPGQIFEADPDKIPESMKDLIIPVDEFFESEK